MKLTYEDKLEIYRLWKDEGWGNRRLAKRFGIIPTSANYICRLIDRHGPEIVRHGKNRKYSREFKEAAIKRVLSGKESVTSVAIDLGLPKNQLLFSWIGSYRENGYTVVERKEGKHARKEKGDGGRAREGTEDPEGREPEAYCRESILKKIECLGFGKRKASKEEIAAVITELRHELKA